MSMKNTLYNQYTKIATNFIGTLKESKFLEKGLLTPEEFLLAGDTMVGKCPTWEWASAADGKVDDKMPADKQYLVTKKVPCPNRIKDIEEAAKAVQEKDVGDGWVETQDNLKKDEAADEVFDLDEEEAAQANKAHVVEENKDDDEEEVMDLDDLEAEEEAPAQKQTENIFASNQYTAKGVDDASGIVANKKMRKYDLSITYDYYHQTPRMWFVGYGPNGELLTQTELFEDIMADYANKTVTFEEHPKQNLKQLSIHPCNHAKAMKRMIDTVLENKGNPKVEFSLFFFLKFISSVTPTIEYDNTVDLELD